jgi:hypothetical protein
MFANGGLLGVGAQNRFSALDVCLHAHNFVLFTVNPKIANPTPKGEISSSLERFLYIHQYLLSVTHMARHLSRDYLELTESKSSTD